MKTLYLNVSSDPYEVMETGEKLREYRKPSKWILSRLIDKEGKLKDIDVVRFIRGYQPGGEPFFVREYLGFYISERNYTLKYSNCLKVNVEVGDIIIKFGRLIESSEHKKNELFGSHKRE